MKVVMFKKVGLFTFGKSRISVYWKTQLQFDSRKLATLLARNFKLIENGK